MSHFLDFKDHNQSLSSIRWYISFLHFKTSKIQFHDVMPLRRRPHFLSTIANFLMKFFLRRWNFRKNIWIPPRLKSDISPHEQIFIFLVPLSIYWPSFPNKNLQYSYFWFSTELRSWKVHWRCPLTTEADWQHDQLGNETFPSKELLVCKLHIIQVAETVVPRKWMLQKCLL